MTTLSLEEAGANFSRLVDCSISTHERFEVTRNGERAAVLLGADDFDSLLETVEILSRADEVRAITEGLADLEADRTSTVAEVQASMEALGRLQR